MTEAIVWTVTFFAFNVLALLTLLAIAVRHDLRAAAGHGTSPGLTHTE